MLDKLIQEMKERGLICIAPIRFIGKAKPVVEMLALMNYTEPEESDPNWWALRLHLKRN